MVKKCRKLTINTWRDKHGNEILIKEMLDFHLRCAITCLERYARDRERNLRLRLLSIVDDVDSNSQDRISAEKKLVALDMEGFSISKSFPKYPKLCAEASRRGLI